MNKLIFIFIGILAIISVAVGDVGVDDENQALQGRMLRGRRGRRDYRRGRRDYPRGRRDYPGRRDNRRGGARGKKTAAQKRQDQRDERRYRNNPYRTMEEERAERRRKHQQAKNRGNPRADPYEPGYGRQDYAREREMSRDDRCYYYGEGCDYHALEYDPWDNDYDYDPIHDEHYPY